MAAITHYRRCGFTLLEVMLVAGLMSLLVLMMSSAWAGLGGPLADNVARSRVAGEAHLAREALRRDFGGILPGAVVGPQQQGQLVGRLVVGGNQLMLCFDGPPLNQSADWAPPDSVIVYDVQDNQLIRSDQQQGTSFMVADHVDQFQVTEQGDGVRIDMTIHYRDVNRTFTLITKDP